MQDAHSTGSLVRETVLVEFMEARGCFQSATTGGSVKLGPNIVASQEVGVLERSVKRRDLELGQEICPKFSRKFARISSQAKCWSREPLNQLQTPRQTPKGCIPRKWIKLAVVQVE